MSESQYVKRWKNWINRKKVFSPDELNELETYLIDKMDSLQEKNQLTEKESFQQALDAMGESGLLNEEYTKIRKSPFDKVKWLALIQTVVSVLLVVFILSSQHNWFEKNSTFPFYGEAIGWFNGMLDYFHGADYQSATYSGSLFITRGADNMIYCFDCFGSNSYDSNISINFAGTYYYQINNQNSSNYSDSSFIQEIAFGDEKELFIAKTDNVIYAYKDNQLIDKIPLPQNPKFEDIVSIKVLNNYLLFLFTPVSINNSVELNNSVLFVLPYSDHIGKQQFQPIQLNLCIIAMETTEDQIIFLTSDGKIQRYSFNGTQLSLKNEQIISNWQKSNDNTPFKMISTNTDRVIVLERSLSYFKFIPGDIFLANYESFEAIMRDKIHFISERYVLTPQQNNQLKLVSMKDKNIVLLTKIKHMNKKRIAIISKHPKEKANVFPVYPGKVNLIRGS